jgi:ribonuclease J
VTTFGSNIARLHTLALIARETGRYMGLLGRSLLNMGSAARATGLWSKDEHLVGPAHLGYLPREEVLAVATGSQGDTRTALRRLADGSHPDLELEVGDRVIFSARTIPGNEEAIEAVISRLQDQGVEVLTPDNVPYPIHASGHPAEEELKAMYRWVKPRIAIPVHGEAMHLEANAAIATACDVPRTMVGQDGDLYMIAPVPGIRRTAAKTGRLGWENGALVQMTEPQL